MFNSKEPIVENEIAQRNTAIIYAITVYNILKAYIFEIHLFQKAKTFLLYFFFF